MIFFLLWFASAAYKPGQLLEYGTRAGRAYFCVETHDPDRILIGQTRRTRRHPAAGTSAQVKYDDEYLWVRLPHGGTVRLRQDYLTRAFTDGSRCEQVVDAAWKRLTAPPKRLLIRGPHADK